MGILDLFDIVANAKYDNNNNDTFLSREQLVDKYMKMFLSEYKIKEDNLLNVFGIFNFVCEEDVLEVNEIRLKKDNYRFLVYDITGHNGEWQIKEFENLKDVEEYILNPGGILNMFTTEMIVLENLKIKKYKVYEIIENSKEIEVFDFEECSSNTSSNLIVRWC